MLAGPLLLLLHAIGPTFRAGEQHDHLGNRLTPSAFFVEPAHPHSSPLSDSRFSAKARLPTHHYHHSAHPAGREWVCIS